jgi:hypothetical protein
VDDPRPVRRDVDAQNAQCLALLSRPALLAESDAERSPNPAPASAHEDTPSATAGLPQSPLKRQR